MVSFKGTITNSWVRSTTFPTYRTRTPFFVAGNRRENRYGHGSTRVPVPREVWRNDTDVQTVAGFLFVGCLAFWEPSLVGFKGTPEGRPTILGFDSFSSLSNIVLFKNSRFPWVW